MDIDWQNSEYRRLVRLLHERGPASIGNVLLEISYRSTNHPEIDELIERAMRSEIAAGQRK